MGEIFGKTIATDEHVELSFWFDETAATDAIGPMLTHDGVALTAQVDVHARADRGFWRRRLTVQQLEDLLRDAIREALTRELIRFYAKEFRKSDSAATGLARSVSGQLERELEPYRMRAYAHITMGADVSAIDAMEKARQAYQGPERYAVEETTDAKPVKLRTPTDEAIAEAVFRYKLGAMMDFGPLQGITHYLSLGSSEDPPERLVTKLANLGYRVKPLSACRTSPEGVG